MRRAVSGIGALEHYITSAATEEKAAAGGRGSERVGRRNSRRSSEQYTPKTLHAGDVQARPDGAGVRRHRRRIDVHQRRAAVRGRRRHLPRPISSRRAIRFRTPSTSSRNCASRSNRAGATLEVLGVGTTGYAKDVLRDVLAADAALVETVAHTESAVKYYKDPHVIIDVGGQDIKLIVLQRRARQGLQAEHAVLGRQRLLPPVDGGDVRDPGGGVRRQRVRGERRCRCSAMAAPCSCSPTSSTSSARAGRRKKFWPGSRRCCRRTSSCTWRSIPNLAKLGIEIRAAGRHAAQPRRGEGARSISSDSNFRGAEVQPEIIVHEHCGESGAIGAAVEARAPVQQRPSHTIHRPRRRAAHHVSHDAQRSDALLISARTTACGRSSTSRWGRSAGRRSSRRLTSQAPLRQGMLKPLVPAPLKFVSKVPKAADEQRLIIATCEKGPSRT